METGFRVHNAKGPPRRRNSYLLLAYVQPLRFLIYLFFRGLFCFVLAEVGLGMRGVGFGGGEVAFTLQKNL